MMKTAKEKSIKKLFIKFYKCELRTFKRILGLK
jgi:hypothetical protein